MCHRQPSTSSCLAVHHMEMASFSIISTFSYRKLQGEERFRVLALEPGEVDVCFEITGNPTPICVQCIHTTSHICLGSLTMHNYSMQSRPRTPYEAISYVWAQDPGEETIHCKEQIETASFTNACKHWVYNFMFTPERPLESFTVTENVGVVLRQLQRLDRPRVLWIDQVRIYADRYRTKYRRNLRFGPLFSEGFRFVLVLEFHFCRPYPDWP
jgi:hypothetical protein